nr:MAG TPA: tail protein [Caudoviricetes sp.]
MYTLDFEVKIGEFYLGMVDSITIHKSVELLADTCEIVLPAARLNKALEIEEQIKRGDEVSVSIGYKEVGIKEEFKGYLQRISTDGGSIKLFCEDDLFQFRKDLPNEELKKISLSDLLSKVVKGIGKNYKVNCSYTWVYDKFVIRDATGYDVLKKVQEECGADIYLKDGVLHIHPPGEVIGKERFYDFAVNIEEAELSFKRAEDKKVKVVVKAIMPDGKVKEIEVGSTGGEKVEVKCHASDTASMKARGEAEVKRRTFDGYDGSITTWLIPECNPGDTASIHDGDYTYKDGTYFVRSVTTEFSEGGGKRKVELGYRLS